MRRVTAVIAFLSVLFLGTPVFADTLTEYNEYKPTSYNEGTVVVLPRQISGEELARIILEETRKISDLSIINDTLYRYIPGPTRKEVVQYRFTIYSWWVESGLKIFFEPQKEYTHLIFTGYPSIIVPKSKTKRHFEELVSRIHKRMETQNH